MPRNSQGTNAAALKSIDDRRWRSVVRREPVEGGLYVYAVATTGVYCRPGCRSRLPRRENVRFFDDRRAAERAGYRACKRCRPDQDSPGGRQARLVARVCRLLDQSDPAPTLRRLASEVGLSPWHLQRLFRGVVGVSPRQYAVAGSCRRLRSEMRSAGSTIQGAARAGYRSAGRFYQDADAALGMTPGSYRRGGEGASIAFATAESSLGWVLVAGTKRGVCAVELGEDPAALERELRRDFPRASIVRDDRALRTSLRRVVKHLERPGRNLDVPLDVLGTAFQRQVWEALRRIPLGRTASYSEIAAALGRPSSACAVARACATNRAAVVVPCHRAVGADGSLTGYRWGLQRKKMLLRREGALDEG